MTTYTQTVTVDGVAHEVRLYIDAEGCCRGHGLPHDLALNDPARDPLSWWCKGYGDAVNGWVRNDPSNEWYSRGVHAWLRSVDDERRE